MCVDIFFNISGNIYFKFFKVIFDVELCSFLLKVEFERSIVIRVFLFYNWGRQIIEDGEQRYLSIVEFV